MSAQPASSPRHLPSHPDQDRLAFIDATAGVAGDMLLGALVDAGADLEAVQAVIDALIPGSVRFSQHTVDRSSQQARKVDVELLAPNPPHRTWSSIRQMLEDAREDPAVPHRTIDLALDVFSRLADAESLAHGIPADEVHFHEVGALDSLADVIGACEAWRQLGITEAVGSVIAVGSGRIRAAHGDIPVPVPAVVRLAQGWPTVSGDMLPARGHSHPHGGDHTHSHGEDHGHPHEDEHEHGPDQAHDHQHEHESEHEHEQDHAHGHGSDHAHDHVISPEHPDPYGVGHLHHALTGDGTGHSHSLQEAVARGHQDPHGLGDDALPEHVVGGPHVAPSRPVPAGIAPGIGELATPTGVALVRGLAATAGPQPTMITDAVGIGAGTKDTPGRPNVVRVMIGRAYDPSAVSGPSAAASSGALAAALPVDAHETPTSAVQLEANVDDLDPRLWPGVIAALLEAGALDAWTTPIVMKQGRPAITVHALVREGDQRSTAEQIMDLTGTLGVRHHHVERTIRTRTFEDLDLGGHRVRVKIAHDAQGHPVRSEPEFRDVQAAARALGITEREALDRARAASARRER